MKRKRGLVILAATTLFMMILTGISFCAKEQQWRLKAAEADIRLSEAHRQIKDQEQAEIVSVPQKTVIALDPGHQGPGVDMSGMEENSPGSGVMKQRNNSGTVGRYSGLPEYQLNLDIAFKVRERLSEHGYDVVMSREDNETAVSNQDRARQANVSGALLCVRIHANGSESPDSSGALCLIASQENPAAGSLYDESSKLAADLLQSYCEATGFENQGIRVDDTMTGINWSQIPVVILEMGFMTNEREDMLMADENFQEKMAQGIAQGIEKYCAERNH